MLKELSAQEFTCNPFTKIGKEWMLITAGTPEHCNTMTASWGGLGVWWGKNTITCYIRQSRYTKEFVDQEDTFTISFFEESYRSALSLCGSVSGRDHDKINDANLTPIAIDQTTAFEEASMVFVCRKLLSQKLEPESFIAKEMDEKWYSDKDYHTMYIAEIEKIFVKA